MEDNFYNVSVDSAVEELYSTVTKPANMPTLFDRWASQQPQCKLGKDGICCHMCGMGPCKIVPNATRGICGATADTIVARNMLRHIAAGAAAYIHHAKEAAKVLSLTAQNKTDFEIKNNEKLREIANAIGLNPNEDKNILAQKVADFYYDDINKPSDSPSELVQIFGPKKRVALWKEIGILPGGAHSELVDSMTRTMGHINTDPADLLKNCLSLSICAMYSGLMMAVHFQDILLGLPRPREIETNLGVLDPHSVNILVHGHQPLHELKILEAQADPHLLHLAKEAGATGIKVYGSTDVGQELVSRDGEFIAGQIGSWMKQELAVATGAVDLVVVDFNCTIPGLKLMADRFHTKVVSVEKVLSMEGIERIAFAPEKATDIGRRVIEIAVEAFRSRDSNRIKVPNVRSTSLIGFSKESIFGTKENLEEIVAALHSGRVNGIVAIAGCTNPHTGKQRSDAVVLAEELIARDILVLLSGCCNSEAQHTDLMTPDGARYAGDGLKDLCLKLRIPPLLSFGSCTETYRIVDIVTTMADAFSVDTADLLCAVSVPEWMDEKSLTDAFFSIAFGMITHISPSLPINGSKRISTFLSHSESKRRRNNRPTALNTVGGEFICESDPLRAATLIEYHLDRKRQRLQAKQPYVSVYKL